MIKKLLLILTVLFLFSTKVSASSLCSYKEQTEINQLAANVKVSYEIAEEIIHFEDGDVPSDYFKISIYNITEKIYVIVKNNINKEEKIFTYDDSENGIVTFRWNHFDSVTNFTVQVYTTNKTSCPDERHKTIYLTTPRFNNYSYRAICSELTDFYLCQEYVTFSDVTEDVFVKQIDSYRNKDIDDSGEKIEDKNEIKTSDKIFDFLDTYKWYIVGGLSTLLVIIIVIIKSKKKKQRELGL